MPHDAAGNELKLGDKVSIEFEVVRLVPEAEICNVDLMSVRELYAHGRTAISCRADAVCLIPVLDVVVKETEISEGTTIHIPPVDPDAPVDPLKLEPTDTPKE